MKKLVRYKADGYTTVLILEPHDQSLMNQHKMLKLFGKDLPASCQTDSMRCDSQRLAGRLSLRLRAPGADGAEPVGHPTRHLVWREAPPRRLPFCVKNRTALLEFRPPCALPDLLRQARGEVPR
jgi:hypothetical protein